MTLTNRVHPHRRCWLVLLFAISLAAGCCTPGTHATPLDPILQAQADAQAAKAHWPGKKFDRVLIIVLENQNYADAIRDPYLNELARHGASFTEFHGLFHPSYPNYLAMIGGKEFKTCGDDQPDEPFRDPTIGQRLEQKSLTWKNYAEGYPGNPKIEEANRYARKHVPFLSFREVQNSKSANVVPGEQFDIDLKNGALPTYSYYSPDLDNDGHDPTIFPSVGLRKSSSWLRDFLDNRFPPARRHGTLIVVTYDESKGCEMTNRIYTVLLGDMVKSAAEIPDKQILVRPYTHYNVLRTIEENFGLAPLADGDGRAGPILDVWK
jgi:hypothetical protein